MRKHLGMIQSGVKHFSRRMTHYPGVFNAATGENLVPGTLNVKVSQELVVKEHFRILGKDIGEPEQDLLFEVCRVNGTWAYRIRPLNLVTGRGGHGDDVIEIACSKHLKSCGLKDGDVVEIVFF